MLVVEHLYDDGMLSATVAELIDVVDRLDIAVDADDLAAVLRLRDTILAKAMESLRAFDELLLYQLTKASSTAQYVHFREHGGPNTPCNCCLLCKYHHHRAAHDPKIRLCMEPDGTLFEHATPRTPASHVRSRGAAANPSRREPHKRWVGSYLRYAVGKPGQCHSVTNTRPVPDDVM